MKPTMYYVCDINKMICHRQTLDHSDIVLGMFFNRWDADAYFMELVGEGFCSLDGTKTKPNQVLPSHRSIEYD